MHIYLHLESGYLTRKDAITGHARPKGTGRIVSLNQGIGVGCPQAMELLWIPHSSPLLWNRCHLGASPNSGPRLCTGVLELGEVRAAVLSLP